MGWRSPGRRMHWLCESEVAWREAWPAACCRRAGAQGAQPAQPAVRTPVLWGYGSGARDPAAPHLGGCFGSCRVGAREIGQLPGVASLRGASLCGATAIGQGAHVLLHPRWVPGSVRLSLQVGRVGWRRAFVPECAGPRPSGVYSPWSGTERPVSLAILHVYPFSRPVLTSQAVLLGRSTSITAL